MRELSTNMSSIFDKLNDLKNLFKFGEKIVPIIQSLIEFMKEIVPLLETINSSISDTANKMPQAANQISNVTNATELATTEILDIVDKITNIVVEVESRAKKALEDRERRAELYAKLRETVQGNGDALETIDELEAADAPTKDLEKTISQLGEVKDNTHQITLSLQVQDITAQQLAAANHLIQSVHERLATLIADIDHSEIKDDIRSLDIDVPEGVDFDPKASYNKDASRQGEVDRILNQQNENKASQEEIDKLFS